MDVLSFSAQVVAVSALGVLAPGPLFAANILYSEHKGILSGIQIANGHAIVEIALIAVIAGGLFSTSSLIDHYSKAIAIIGGFALLGFASSQVYAVLLMKKPILTKESRTPFVVGVLLTALNPFFLIWWLTVGLKLIADSSEFGPIVGVGMLFGLHIWMDYAWLAATAYLASKGWHILGSKYYKLLTLALTAVLVCYGTLFLASGFA